jgi:hypothetical protein
MIQNKAPGRSCRRSWKIPPSGRHAAVPDHAEHESMRKAGGGESDASP